jgi:hypothetical protein
MSHAVQCRICGKTTWSGCGLHVNAVKRKVPPEHWCCGHRDDNLRLHAGVSSRRKGRR